MKNNKRADTIAWIIIAVFILSFAMLWIVNVLDYNQNISDNYEKETDSYILKSNSENILKRLNIDHIEQDQKFWIYKNEGTNMYEVVTWTWNEMYRYVDKDGRKVDPATNLWKTFIREFKKKIDILRYDIKPPEINNLVFHFDANNIDWDDNSTLTWWVVVNSWRNLAGNWVPDAVDKSNITSFSASYTSQLPTFNIDWLNWKPMVEFNWINQMLGMAEHPLINTNRVCWIAPIFYPEKSFAIVFKTSDNITSQQMIYEQWSNAIWYNFMIFEWQVWAWIHNYATWDFNKNWCSSDRVLYPWSPENRSVSLTEVLPNTIYFIMVVHDSSNALPSQNKIKIYLNWVFVMEADWVRNQTEHFHWWIGNIFDKNRNPKNWDIIDDTLWHTAYFKWWIWELISRNHALTENEIRGVQNYFSQKWLWGKASIRYDIVESTIKEFKEY